MTDTANREESTHEYRHIEYRHSASHGGCIGCNPDVCMTTQRLCRTPAAPRSRNAAQHPRAASSTRAAHQGDPS